MQQETHMKVPPHLILPSLKIKEGKGKGKGCHILFLQRQCDIGHARWCVGPHQGRVWGESGTSQHLGQR